MDTNPDVQDSGLPTHVEALVKAKHDHAAELSRLNVILSDMQDQFLKGKKEKDLFVLETNTLISKICVLEEEGGKRKVHVEELEKEISRAIEERAALRYELRMKEMECNERQRKCAAYRKKMETYKVETAESERETQARVELNKVKRQVEELQCRKENLHQQCQTLLDGISGDTENTELDLDSAKRNICHMESDVNNQRARLQDLKHTLEETQEEKKKIETANTILQKRNTALVTRLQRQVEEQRDKQEQLTSHVHCTVEKINAIKDKLNLNS